MGVLRPHNIHRRTNPAPAGARATSPHHNSCILYIGQNIVVDNEWNQHASTATTNRPTMPGSTPAIVHRRHIHTRDRGLPPPVPTPIVAPLQKGHNTHYGQTYPSSGVTRQEDTRIRLLSGVEQRWALSGRQGKDKGQRTKDKGQRTKRLKLDP